MSRKANRRTTPDTFVPDISVALVIVYEGGNEATFREYLAYIEEHAADVAEGPGRILAKVYGRESAAGAAQLMMDLALELGHPYTFTLEEPDGGIPIITLR